MVTAMKNKKNLEAMQESWLEPDDPKVLGKDYKNEDLFFGDEVYVTEDGYVLVDDLQDYFVSKYGKALTLE